ncbi:fungal-specific transcription factor domain-containing protein [Aspergillus germanicus]
MSLAQPVKTPYQPFQCLICQSRFTRHENLKRHALLHTRSQGEGSLPCDFCEATFSRPDLRHRHMKRKHPEQEQRRARKKTQRSPEKSVSPESYNFDEDVQPVDDYTHQFEHETETPRIEASANVMDLNSLLDNFRPVENYPSFYHAIHDTPSPKNDWSPSRLQVTHGCDLFFAHVSHFVPFLHKPTFNHEQAPSYLLLSILSLAYQYGPDPESNHPTSTSGTALSHRCFHHARTLITPENAEIATVQAYLLLQICAMLYLCGADSAHGLKMHSITIPLARTVGLMQPLPLESAATQDLDTLWHAFLAAESHKRTLFALHQIDALWYQFLSIPRSISHLEIKHDLPCPEDHWNAASAAEWAHRQLITRQGQGPGLQYADSVRRFLSQDIELSTVPVFDPYGAINIAQFLISSAREISGWSAMTGMLSIDRFGALRSSLVALNPFICPNTPTIQSTPEATTPHTAIPTPPSSSTSLCPATWHTAMIELQIWSPSHTSGIIQSSLDGVLHQSSYLSPSGDILCEDITVAAIQVHVDWFLRYLDDTVEPRGEAPWVALYAFKAFLIAWQLVKGRLPGAMGVVGVGDGDVEGAVSWARHVFGRREGWTLGRLILGSLDQLE